MYCKQLTTLLAFGHSLFLTDAPQEDELDHMTAVQLKALCKEHGLKVSGKKADLQARLRGHFLLGAASDDYDSMSDEDLCDVCKTRGLKETGTRKALLERLRQDGSFLSELNAAMTDKDNNAYLAISKALEKAAKGNDAISEIMSEIKQKTEAEPKYVEVTVKSLGMTPEKFTTGGSPSATADVIRKLAGDPFADDGPKYGTVRGCLTIDLSGSKQFVSHTCACLLCIHLLRRLISLEAAKKDEKRVKLCLVFVRLAPLIP